MSFWSYANFKFKVNKMLSVSEIESLVGHMVSFDDILVFNEDNLDDSYRLLPDGSEGTLDIVVKRTTRYSTEFNVYGGLRDTYDIDQIIDWYNRIVEDNHDKPIIDSISGTAYSDLDCDVKKFSYKYKYSLDERLYKIKRVLWNIFWR